MLFNSFSCSPNTPSPALYGMYGLGQAGFPPGYPMSSLPTSSAAPTPPTTDTLGVAASQAASLNWWGMASQLATQDYLSRLGVAARDPAQVAALQAQELVKVAKIREAGEVVVSSEGLRLPRVSRDHVDLPTIDCSAAGHRDSAHLSPFHGREAEVAGRLPPGLPPPTASRRTHHREEEAGPQAPGGELPCVGQCQRCGQGGDHQNPSLSQ